MVYDPGVSYSITPQNTPAASPGIDWLALLVVLLALGVLALQLVRGRRVRRLLEHRVAELRALSEAGRAIVAAQLDVDELCLLIYEQVRQIADTWIFQLGLFEDQRYRIKVWINRGERLPETVFELGADEGIVGWVRRTGQPLLVRDFEKEMATLPAQPRYLQDDPPRSAVFVPLVAGEKVIGAMAVQSHYPGAFTTDHQRVLTIIANQAASALENARLFAAGQEEAWISTALLEVAEATGLARSVDEVLETVVRITPLLVGVDRCLILLHNPAGGGYEIAAAYAAVDDPAPLAVGQVIAPGEWPLMDQLWETGSPIVDEFGGIPGAPATQDIETTLLALPLRAQGELTGGMVIGFTGQVSFSEHRIKLIAGIANQAALAIESAGLLAAQQEEAWVSLALLQVAEAVANLSELEDLLDVVARLTPLLVGVESCLVYLWDDKRGAFVPGAAYGIPAERMYRFHSTSIPAELWPEMIQAASGPDAPARSGEFAARREALAYERTANEEQELWQLGGTIVPVSGPPHSVADALGLDAPLALPLQIWNELVGAIVVSTTDTQAALSGRRLNILVGVAQQTATAIQNTRLQRESIARQQLEHELQLARQIQASFLPAEVPDIPGWDLAAYWQGARQVSGDFYDFVRLPDAEQNGRWGFVVADVADKGMPAALFMALSRTLVRTMATAGHEPAEVLERANDMIMADSGSDLFVTLFYAVLDPQQALLSYANAGHNPPLHLNDNNPMSHLQAQGIALGVIAGIQLEQQATRVEPGDVLVFYTDGITDALNGEIEEFGLARLCRVVEKHQAESAAEIVHAIDRAVREFVGETPQFDDLTLLVLKRQPDEAER